MNILTRAALVVAEVELTVDDAEAELDLEVTEEDAALFELVLEAVAADVLAVEGEEEAELAVGARGRYSRFLKRCRGKIKRTRRGRRSTGRRAR
jgi:hypothetical protein